VGKWLIKGALALADFRSYRDAASLQYLTARGLTASDDPIYPDLAFSLPKELIPVNITLRRRSVVGLGVMESAGRYGVESSTTVARRTYLTALVGLVTWLLSTDHDVRLLTGDMRDRAVISELKDLLGEKKCNAGRVIDEPISSPEELLSQLGMTDFVVATRFHNVLLALLAEKPTICVSFHHKCSSLMSMMNLSSYCVDINEVDADKLIRKMCQLEMNADGIKAVIREKAQECRESLDRQYEVIVREVGAVERVHGKRSAAVKAKLGL
jgi:polysaccharide pyruvyl transferase WcaK-like protein